MAINPVYPLALVILGGVAAMKMEFVPYAAGGVVLLLAVNSLRSSLHPLRLSDD